MIRIGISVFTAPEAGGAYQYTRSLLQAVSIFDRDKYEVTVYSPFAMWDALCSDFNLGFKQLSESRLRKVIYHMGYELIRFNITNSVFYRCHPMWQAYKNDGLDIMIISSPTWYGKIKGAKLIVPIFDLMHRYISFEEVGGAGVYEERDRRYTAICKDTDGVLVDSELGRHQMIDSYGKCTKELDKRVYSLPFIVPDYVSQAVEAGINEENAAAGKEVNNLPDKFIFYPAQFWKHKNHVNLLTAIGQLKSEGIKVNIVLTGSNKNAMEDIQRVIGQYELTDEVYNLGYLEDDELVYIYKKARALVFASFGGPTNIPPLEAMALGCPVAVANNFAMPEQVGDAGITFAPDSVEEIKDAVRRLWTDDALCGQLSEKGLIRSRQWTVREFSSNLEAIINDVLLTK